MRHRFGRFEVRADKRRLFVDGQPAPLGARAFDLLLALIERRERLVTKEELLQLVWPGLVVGENNLHTQVSTLRSLLGSQAIATVAGRGYRFAMKVDSDSVVDALQPVAVVLGTAMNRASINTQPLLPTPPIGPSGTPSFTRKLAAIMSSDVVGYSRLMSEDDHATLEAIVATRSVMAKHITRLGGRVVDASGDALLAEFPSAVESVRCAVAIQDELARRNLALPEGRRMALRIGLNVGDVIEQDTALYGEGVNVAARLQALGEPGGVCISGSIFDQVDGKLPLAFRFAGEQAVKNIAKAVRAYHIGAGGPLAATHPTRSPGARNSNEYRFGSVEVRPDERSLLVAGEPAKLGARAFDVLLALIDRRARVVSKNELLDLVWPGVVVVEENNLQTQISNLRKLLGSQAIETIPGRGYRFVAVLDGGRPQPPPAPVALAAALGTVQAAGAPAVREFKTNLPEALPELFGRADDVVALGALIGQHRLVSIVAAGGMGKTRLALQLLHERREAYAQGVCWVELAGLSDPQLVVSTIASALGIQTGSGEPLAGLVASLKGMTLLVALDNAEHLVDEVARVVQAISEAAPNLHLLVTSQVPLKCARERVYRLGPLAVPDVALPVEDALTFGAVALFAECAHAADRHFALTPGNVSTVIDICHHLDGMALAIELAAARVAALGVAKLAATLNERLRVLTGGVRSAPQRQKTLRAALEWSHALLDPAEQAVFRRLGVFAGGFSLEVAQKVVADEKTEPRLDEWAVLDILGALVDRSLVMADAGARPRYRLLESPRVFALERLAAAKEGANLQRRHAQAVLAHFAAVEAECWGGRVGVDAAIALLEPDLDNGREALSWGLKHDPHTAIALAPPLDFALTWNRREEQIRMWEATAEQMAKDIPETFQAAWSLACSRFWGGFDAKLAAQRAQTAIAIHRRIAEPIALYRSLSAFCHSGDSNAIDLAQDALRELRELENPVWPAWVRYFGARAELWVCVARGDLDGAQSAVERMFELAERAGSSNAALGARGDMADVALSAGRADEAVRIGLDLERQIGMTREQSILTLVRTNLTGAMLVQGAIEPARAMAKSAWLLAKQFDRLDWLVDNLAWLVAVEGHARQAARLLGFADAMYVSSGRIRQINEGRAAERAEGLARDQIGASEFEQLKAAGAGLSADEIAALAFGMP